MRTHRKPSLVRATAALLVLATALAGTPGTWAANHREAPITALDHKADITDFFAFVSYDDANKVTLILDVDVLGVRDGGLSEATERGMGRHFFFALFTSLWASATAASGVNTRNAMVSIR